MKKLLAILPVVLLSACSLKSPVYQPSLKNVQALNNSDVQQVNVGAVTSAPALNQISLRGSKMMSHVGSGYGDYLKAALTEELKLAKLYSAVSSRVVEAELMQNDIDVTGFSTGDGIIEAKFTVTENGEVKYEKALSAKNEFESSFVGAIAIPNAQNSYVGLVQNLLNQLFTDPEFIAAIK